MARPVKIKKVFIITIESIIRYLFENIFDKHETSFNGPFKTSKLFINEMTTSKIVLTGDGINIFCLKSHTTKEFI